MSSLTVPSPLPPDLEDLVRRVIGALIRVHRELGAGLSESIYAAATRLELQASGIAFEAEKSVPVRYRGQLLGYHYVDLLVEGKVVVELKSVECLRPVHVAQVVMYLRLTGARIGLLANFNVPILKQGLRRVIR